MKKKLLEALKTKFVGVDEVPFWKELQLKRRKV